MDQRMFDNLKAVEKMLSSCKSYVKKVRTGTQRKGLMTTDWNHFLSTQMTKVQETLKHIQSSILGQNIHDSEHSTSNGHVGDPHGPGQNGYLGIERETTRLSSDDARENEQKLRTLRSQLIACEERNNGLEERLRELKKENEGYQERLNDIAHGQVYNNAVDSNDENTPTAITEKMRELYDNEWQSSLDRLTKHMTESAAIQTLSRILQTSYEFCEKVHHHWQVCLARTASSLTGFSRDMQISTSFDNFSKTQPDMSKIDLINHTEGKGEKHISRISVGVTITGVRHSTSPRSSFTGAELHMPHLLPGCDDLIKHLQKCSGSSLIQQVQKMFFAQCQEVIPQDTKLYAERCVELCWLMCLQSPQIVLKSNIVEGETVNGELFTPYSKTGETVEFLVWPAMCSHSDGSILSKGVVQCK